MNLFKTLAERAHALLFGYMIRTGIVLRMSATDALLDATPAPAPSPGAPTPPAPSPAPAAPAPAPGAPVPPAPAPGATAWPDGLDAATQQYITAKGFKNPGDALTALRSYEPPESPDKYELPVPTGEDPAFSKAVAPLMHKAGLSVTQAKALAEGWNELQATQRQQAQQAEEARAREAEALAERQDADLRREWGQSYDANAEHGRRAVAAGAAAAGIDAKVLSDALGALESKIGYAAMMKFFAFYGKPLAESPAHGMGGARPGTSPAAPNVTGFYDRSNMNP